MAGGQGLAGAHHFTLLADIGAALGASLGGTRVASDAGWIAFERQIGTTGVAVDPDLYLAFGISGATQHTAGLGHPEHIISVNTDPSCPMMAMADLAVVADARAVIDALIPRLLRKSPENTRKHPESALDAPGTTAVVPPDHALGAGPLTGGDDAGGSTTVGASGRVAGTVGIDGEGIGASTRSPNSTVAVAVAVAPPASVT